MLLKQQITKKLAQRKVAGLLRQPRIFEHVTASRLISAGKEYVNFSSNDYLGIATDSQQDNKAGSGAMASPLVVGQSKVHQDLKNTLLEWYDAPDEHDCLLFSSGFAANTGVIRALFEDKTSNALLVQDRLNHASLLDAGKVCQSLGGARQIRFKHNDFNDLNCQLERFDASEKNALVVTEGIFSMDGDAPDLKTTLDICRRNRVPWMLDDAHGIGVSGKSGQGSLFSQGLGLSDCDILVVTFGKAVGAQGAAVIANKDIIEYLINFSKEYIYSTHISPVQTQAVLNNLRLVQSGCERRGKLKDNIAYFRKQFELSKWRLMASQSSIQPILVGNEIEAVNLSENLRQQGIWINAMRYPTVAKNQARLRVTLTSHHTRADIDKLMDVLHD